jgi:phospholipid/cholesterol/gamma-HCH transport system substrate-binding protein
MRRIFNNRILGVLFIGLMVLALWFVVALFNQKFSSFDEVKMTSSTVGLQLPSRADVKVRGVIVGQVLEAESQVDEAVLTLGIKPDEIGSIPDNVTASILPKTLFGEKYISLDIPEEASTASLQDGDAITQTKLPIEVEKVLNDLYPLLTTLQPAELNYTLNAVATALEGRGEKIGRSVSTFNSYLKQMNPLLPPLIEDLRLLSTVSDTYADVMPELAATLRNTVKTGNTLVEKEARLTRFLRETAAFSETTKSFLDANGDNIVQLGKVSQPTLALLRRYAPTTPCLLRGIVKQAPQLASTFRGFIFHINLITVNNQPRGYTAGDKPVFGADNAPNCAGLPNPPVPDPGPPNIKDGVNGLARGDHQRTAPGFARETSTIPSTYGGTKEARTMLDSLAATAFGMPVDEVPGLTSLLLGPSVAGTTVSAR